MRGVRRHLRMPEIFQCEPAKGERWFEKVKAVGEALEQPPRQRAQAVGRRHEERSERITLNGHRHSAASTVLSQGSVNNPRKHAPV